MALRSLMFRLRTVLMLSCGADDEEVVARRPTGPPEKSQYEQHFVEAVTAAPSIPVGINHLQCELHKRTFPEQGPDKDGLLISCKRACSM